MKNISILGCGWLGLPLAKSLINEGYTINGSTTSEEKLVLLNENNINPYLISLEENKIIGDFENFLHKATTLIIDIPPKLRGTTSENFVSKIKNVIPYIEKSSIKNVLFVSSTSVYEDSEKMLGITEQTIPNPDSEGGKQLLEVEKLLQKNPNFNTTILRFGGLIGPDRHPVKFLAGRSNLENPEAPINLIHQQDCIGIILQLLTTNSWNQTFNGVAPFHPSRKEYYTQKAIENNLAIPHFDASKVSLGKTILSDKIKTILNYEFKIGL